MTRFALLLTAVALLLGACESERVDPLEMLAASACASVQTWIDAVEDDATALSRAVTPLDDPAARVPHFRAFARSVRERTDDLVRQLRRIAPRAGAGRAAADDLVAALERSLAITDELVALTATFPEDDDESLAGRISSLLVRLEKAFVHPARARDELAARHSAFRRAPACVDYADPVT